jgi:hypothetical protein
MSAQEKTVLLGAALRVNLALACIAVLASLAVIEFGYRAATDRPVFALKSWRAEKIERSTFGERAMFDPLLGWTLQEWYNSDGYNTIDHGIRRNSSEEDIRTGGVLAVGDSFTDGWDDVRDEETWPAHLESLLGTPVLNGGVGGYATDQIVMRAERLLPLVRPKTLVVGFLEEDISRAGHSVFGAPKPYFTLKNGELRYHPPGPIVVDERGSSGWGARMRDALGYSAVLDFVIGRLSPGYWYGSAGQEVFRKVDNDPVGVTCALLERLKRRADGEGVRVLLFMQHGWHMIVDKEAPSEHARLVSACAAGLGIEVVDQFPPLRAIATANRDALRDFYVREGDGYGHMSSKGNRHAAELLARAIEKSGTPGSSAPPEPPAPLASAPTSGHKDADR